jgi:hypothetical protein
VASEALRTVLASGPVVTGATHPGYVVKLPAARGAALTVAEQAPGDVLLLLEMLGLTGKGGPGDGKWAVYAYGRPSTTKKEVSR